MTHDVKGHLAAIQTCLELVTGQIIGPLNDQQADFLGRAHGRTKSVVNFIKTLLRLTEVRLCDKLDMAVFSLRDSLNRVVTHMKARALDKSIDLSCCIESSVNEICGNAFFIEEALTNLLLNAIKYTPEHGTITVVAKSEGANVFVEIADTGIGIPEDDLDKVFEEFYRAENARTTERDGTGLGLSFARHVIERHAGRIWVESNPGKGSTFNLTLPKALGKGSVSL